MQKETGILIRTIKRGDSASYEKQAGSFGVAIEILTTEYRRHYRGEITLSNKFERLIRILIDNEVIEKLIEMNKLSFLEVRYLILLIKNELAVSSIRDEARVSVLRELESTLNALVPTPDKLGLQRNLRSKLLAILKKFENTFEEENYFATNMEIDTLVHVIIKGNVLSKLISIDQFSLRDWKYLMSLVTWEKTVSLEIRNKLKLELKKISPFLVTQIDKDRSDEAVFFNGQIRVLKSDQRRALLVKNSRVFDKVVGQQKGFREVKNASLVSALGAIYLEFKKLRRLLVKTPDHTDLLEELAHSNIIEELILANSFTLEDLDHLKCLIIEDTVLGEEWSQEKNMLLDNIDLNINRYAHLFGITEQLIASENQ